MHIHTIPVIFNDDDFLVLDKPPGMLSIPDRFDVGANSISEILKDHFGEIFVVHRLDRETSGVILFAKNADAHRALNLQFESHEARKGYEAIVDGVVALDEETIDLPLMPHPRRKGLMCVAKKDGKNAVTHYRVITRFRDFTHVAINLETGRQHQIRVHFAAINHPLAVDAQYGKRAALLLSSIKKKYRASGEEHPLIARLTLHAASLTINHPQTLVPCTFQAPLPKDMTATLKQLERCNK